jgi:hypothetical protein
MSENKIVKITEIDKLVKEALYIEAESAKRAGTIGYMARALTIATMPHTKTKENSFVRRNGDFSLALVAHPDVGLPYGTIPRCVTCWITTEAVKKKTIVIELGNTLTSFMEEIDLVPTGGRWGTIPRLRTQIERLFSCAVMCRYSSEKESKSLGLNFSIAEAYNLWWDPHKPDQGSLWKSTVKLGKWFFDEITTHPVPVDLRAFKALKRSPLAIDIYCWLTYRYSYLDRIVEIPWPALQMQFGSGYPFNTRGTLDFKSKFKKQLKKVMVIYDEANVDETKYGLVLKPSPTHVFKIKKQN